MRYSISAAASFSAAVPSRIRSPSAARATSRALLSSREGAGEPISCGQKWFSCARAAEWKVRAAMPGAPRDASRARSSAAARVVKVSAITRFGGYTPDATP